MRASKVTEACISVSNHLYRAVVECTLKDNLYNRDWSYIYDNTTTKPINNGDMIGIE
jgi:hypothetical protein